MKTIQKYVILSIIITNFVIPFILILRNRGMTKKKKIKMLARAILIMGLISFLSILWVFK